MNVEIRILGNLLSNFNRLIGRFFDEWSSCKVLEIEANGFASAPNDCDGVPLVETKATEVFAVKLLRRFAHYHRNFRENIFAFAREYA